MVIVEITRSKSSGGVPAFQYGSDGQAYGPIKRIRIQGHAGFVKRGKDIVCAAASVTAYTAAGALEELCGIPNNVVTEKDGYFELRVPDIADANIADRANIITETTYIGYKQIEASYRRHIKIIETIE